MNYLTLTALTLFSLGAPMAAQAQPTAYPPLISVTEDCGYCDRNNTFYDSCKILSNGAVVIEHHKVKKGVVTDKKSESKVTANELAALNNLVDQSETAPTAGKVETGSGDLPSFQIIARPEGVKPIYVEIYSVGKQYLDSAEAKKLARLSAGFCGMQTRRIYWDLIGSKLKP